MNFAACQGGPFELALTLGYREGEAQPLITAPLVMSWEHVPILITLLQEQVSEYERLVGPIPDVQQPRSEAKEGA